MLNLRYYWWCNLLSLKRQSLPQNQELLFFLNTSNNQVSILLNLSSLHSPFYNAVSAAISAAAFSKQNIHHVMDTQNKLPSIPFQSGQVHTFLLCIFFIKETLYKLILGYPEDIIRFEEEVGWVSKEICQD